MDFCRLGTSYPPSLIDRPPYLQFEPLVDSWIVNYRGWFYTDVERFATYFFTADIYDLSARATGNNVTSSRSKWIKTELDNGTIILLKWYMFLATVFRAQVCLLDLSLAMGYQHADSRLIGLGSIGLVRSITPLRIWISTYVNYLWMLRAKGFSGHIQGSSTDQHQYKNYMCYISKRWKRITTFYIPNSSLDIKRASVYIL